MADNESKGFLDELKESMEKVRVAVQDGLEQAEKEVVRFFEELETETEEVVEDVVDAGESEKAETHDGDETADASKLASQIDEVVAEAKAILEGAAEEVGEKWEVLEEKIRAVVITTLDSLGISSDQVLVRLKARISELEKAFEELRKERCETSSVEIRSLGGGWYEIVVDGEVVDKVQGKAKAEKVAAEHGWTSAE